MDAWSSLGVWCFVGGGWWCSSGSGEEEERKRCCGWFCFGEWFCMRGSDCILGIAIRRGRRGRWFPFGRTFQEKYLLSILVAWDNRGPDVEEKGNLGDMMISGAFGKQKRKFWGRGSFI